MTQTNFTAVAGRSLVKCDLAGELLRSAGSLRLTAAGRSMLPAIWPGDTLIVVPVRPEEVHIGDVVVIGRHGGLCAHRVVGTPREAKDARWITQGDAMPAPDPPVLPSELMGRVEYVIRAGRLIAVSAALTGVQRVTSKVIRRAVPAARAMVFIHRVLHFSQRSISKEHSCSQ